MLIERRKVMKKGVKQLLNKWTAVLLLICMTVGILQLPGSRAEAQESTAPSLKAAILSDVHIGYNYGDLANGWKQIDWFKYILQWYKNADVDAVIIPGDLVDAADNQLATAESQFADFFDVWNSVFPAKKGEDGYVEPIFIYGNHDKPLTQNEATGKYWEKYLGEALTEHRKDVVIATKLE
jgi:metallophosphoesterase superfamily enzyme